MKKALIAMSGGVDSSVAAFLMKQQGFDCMGVTMKLYDNDDIGIGRDKTCCSLDDIEDARSVAFHLGIPYHVFNFKDAFEEKVIKKFISVYESGGTPNPCIDCNRYLKFEELFRRAEELGYSFIATGHYARTEYDEKSQRWLLKKGIDNSKDQSYVLYSLTQEQLSRTLFPLGNYSKDKIRRIALQNHFVNSAKRDSQDICFVPDGDYAEFIEEYTGKKYPKGNFVNKRGEVLGTHKGIIRYTVGQRKGLGISYKEPLYVCGKNPERNEVVLGSVSETLSRGVIISDINLISVSTINEPLKVKARTRYNMKEQPAAAEQLDENRIKITFDEPQRSTSTGQSAVMYDGDTVVGGGVVSETF